MWNLLLARARDPESATALAAVIGCVLLAPFAALTWHVDSAAVPYIAASAALELAYFALLAAAYARGRLSAIYPLARGSAPVLVLVVSVAALGVSLSAAQAVGVLLVGTGVLVVRGRGAARPPEVALALGVGACIAGYTLVDNAGIEHASPLPYLEAVLVVPALAYLAMTAVRRGREKLRAELTPATVLAGAGVVSAYALTLAALARASAAPVAAARETSIVVATVLGALVLREPVGRLGFAGSAVIVLGVAAIALG